MHNNLSEIVQAILQCKTEAEVEVFLLGILTPKELQDVCQRLKIVKLLKQGMPHHMIAEKLGVGVATVTRGSKQIQLGRFKTV